jgi:hypothetical protein
MATSISIPALDPSAPTNGLSFVIAIFSRASFFGIFITSTIQDSAHPLKKSQLQLERNARFDSGELVMTLIVLTVLRLVVR